MKTFVVIISVLFGLSTVITAQSVQNNPELLMESGRKSLDEGKFVEARYFYKRAYVGFSAQDNYSKAIICGLKANALYVREYYYKEAFELCYNMDELIANGEQKQNTKFYDLRILLIKERLDMYMKLRNGDRAREQLIRLEEIENLAGNDSITEDVLYTKANYYYTFGQVKQGMDSYKQLIEKYQQQGDVRKISDCYKKMILLSEKLNNASLTVDLYEQYIAWGDSMKTLAAETELVEMRQQYDDSQTALKEKDSALSSRQYIIVGLCVLSVILVAGLVILTIFLLRFIWLTGNQKKSIEIIKEHNRLKSQFVQNISAQIDPALHVLSQTVDELSDKKSQQERMKVQIEALTAFCRDVQELASLENSLDEFYELKECGVNLFCENIIRQIKPFVNPEVELQTCTTFKLQAKINQEHLERVLIHLLKNAARYTNSGKISLEFKKKGGSVCQFIVTDTGTGISPELQENLLKPFSTFKDLVQGTGLGLPICSLIVMKMKGSLTLDPSYTKGCRFVLELRT